MPLCLVSFSNSKNRIYQWESAVGLRVISYCLKENGDGLARLVTRIEEPCVEFLISLADRKKAVNCTLQSKFSNATFPISKS